MGAYIQNYTVCVYASYLDCKPVAVLKCDLPFRWKGVLYNECTKVDHHMPWCATRVSSDARNTESGMWGNCELRCDSKDNRKYLLSAPNY